LQQIDGAFETLEPLGVSRFLGKNHRAEAENQTQEYGEEGISHVFGYERKSLRDKPIPPVAIAARLLAETSHYRATTERRSGSARRYGFKLARRRCLSPIASVNPLRLGVNIDHVATLRQARYSTMPESKNAEPDPIAIAGICERAGAHGITAHLRADRRHIQDRDIERLRDSIMTKLNLELGNTPEIVDIALRILPDEVCLVPEKRQEVTTEGGLDVIANSKELATTVKRFHAAGVRVSLFIDPMLEQIDAAAELSVDIVELHTGKLANAFAAKIAQQELERLRAAALAANGAKLQVNAGHGINYQNMTLIHKIPHLVELNIGHSIVARSVFVGFDAAVREMLGLMENYKG
jgi:pyridoxine 5-phosphate synthase